MGSHYICGGQLARGQLAQPAEMNCEPTGHLMGEEEEKERLNRISSGDVTAFEALFHQHSRRCVEYARLLLHDGALADEVVSDVFYSFWQRREALSAIDNFRSYLYSSIRYKAWEYRKKEERGRVVALDDYLETDAVDPFLQMDGRELAVSLQQLIEQLPSQRRLIFKLKKEDRLSYKEIATLLEISEKTVENQMGKALKSIRTWSQQLTNA